MASGGALPLDRLRQFLRELSTGARKLLVAELERAVLRGDGVPGGDMLLQEVRAAARSAGEQAPRLGAAARAFFRPLEPFLIDTMNQRKAPARIARASLDPIWRWIARDLVPTETKAYDDAVSRAIAAGESTPPEAVVQAFQDRVAARMSAALEASRSDDKARRKMTTQIATAHALEEIKDTQAILAARGALDLIARRLPGHIANLSDSTLEYVKGLLDAPLCAGQGLQPYALVMVANRLGAPWQLIRLGVKAVDSDEATRIAASPYALAVTITLDDIARMVDELRSDLKRGATVAVTALLKCIHDAVRGVRSEIDLSADSPWARELAMIRSDISTVLRAEVESVPGRVRRLLRPRPSQEIAYGAVLDGEEVAETAAMIGFVGACRNYAGELAASEVTLRTFQELRHYLDSGTRALLDALRSATEHDRAYRKSQMDAAIAFCGKAFGKDYASLLTKAAEIAEHGERKVAARV
jgi:hypothetical protein